MTGASFIHRDVLSPNSINQLLSVADGPNFDPSLLHVTVQVIKIIPINSVAHPRRFRILLSDGTHYCQSIMENNVYLETGILCENSILQINGFWKEVAIDMPFIVLIDFDILSNPGCIIGSPSLLKTADVSNRPLFPTCTEEVNASASLILDEISDNAAAGLYHRTNSVTFSTVPAATILRHTDSEEDEDKDPDLSEKTPIVPLGNPTSTNCSLQNQKKPFLQSRTVRKIGDAKELNEDAMSPTTAVTENATPTIMVTPLLESRVTVVTLKGKNDANLGKWKFKMLEFFYFLIKNGVNKGNPARDVGIYENLKCYLPNHHMNSAIMKHIFPYYKYAYDAMHIFSLVVRQFHNLSNFRV